MTANGLTANQQYYFAIVSMDELQPSPLSNVPTGQTQDSIAPAQILDLSAAAPSIPQAVTVAQSSGEAPPNGNLQAIDVHNGYLAGRLLGDVQRLAHFVGNYIQG